MWSLDMFFFMVKWEKLWLRKSFSQCQPSTLAALLLLLICHYNYGSRAINIALKGTVPPRLPRCTLTSVPLGAHRSVLKTIWQANLHLQPLLQVCSEGIQLRNPHPLMKWKFRDKSIASKRGTSAIHYPVMDWEKSENCSLMDEGGWFPVGLHP